jgi:diguanylate cyclase (GGDEF)-like protein
MALPVCVLAAFLLLSSPVDGDAQGLRSAVLCSFGHLFLSAALILSLRRSAALFLAAAGILAVLLALERIRMGIFFILLLINAGGFLLARRHAAAFVRALTDETETLRRLQIEANTDCLTQLLNRSGLEQAAEDCWAFCKRNGRQVGVLMVDIDFFKSYNDAFGHLEGDNILKRVSDSIRDCFGEGSEIIGRIGGEEFLIILLDADEERLVETAQRLAASITDLKIRTNAESCPCEFLSVSIGAANRIPQTQDMMADLYKEVDKALYHAKKSGRNCISYRGSIIRNVLQPSDDTTGAVQAVSV